MIFISKEIHAQLHYSIPLKHMQAEETTRFSHKKEKERGWLFQTTLHDFDSNNIIKEVGEIYTWDSMLITRQ